MPKELWGFFFQTFLSIFIYVNLNVSISIYFVYLILPLDGKLNHVITVLYKYNNLKISFVLLNSFDFQIFKLKYALNVLIIINIKRLLNS